MFDLIDEYDYVGDNDLSRTRVLTVGNRYTDEKMKITISSVGSPYGFWSIKFSSGEPPKWLSGQYTSYQFARGAVDKYIQEHRQERKVTKEELLKKKG